MNLLGRLDGHIWHEGLLINRPNHASLESRLCVRSIDAWEGSSTIDRRELRADKPAVGLGVLVEKWSLVKALQRVGQFADELERHRDIRQFIFGAFNRYHVALVLLSVVARVVKRLMNIAAVDLINAAASNGYLSDVQNNRFQLFNVVISRQPNVDPARARCILNVRLKQKTANEKAESWSTLNNEKVPVKRLT